MNSPKPALPAGIVETNKTDETYAVSNRQFLEAVFEVGVTGQRPVVVIFSGNPSKVAKKVWFGRPWSSEKDGCGELSADANNYFSLAVFRPDEAGEFRRRNACFVALHAVMLDDVGTKVQMERLTLQPSWLIETSPDNYQAGYMFDEPLTDGPAADRLMKAIIAAELCDPGASGPRARLARLPVAVNGKHEPPFQCRMVKWRPELRYSMDELVDGLQLEMAPTGRPERQSSRNSLERPGEGDPVWIPRPDENRVLLALQGRGLYKTPLGDGKHDITCPWVLEHTGAVDDGTAYFEPDDSRRIGGFKCQHGHCADRRVRDLLRFVDVEVSGARLKPTIRVVAGEIDQVVDAGERALTYTHRLYQRGGLIVIVGTDPDAGMRGTSIMEINQLALVRELACAAVWERFDGRAKDWTRIDPPERATAVLFNSSSFAHLPVLRGLTRQPHLRPDGSLMAVAGYDVATGMFGAFDESEFSVPDEPTLVQAEAALVLLKSLLHEFSFAGETDVAAVLAAMVTAVVRPSLPHAPMFHVRAHMAGSGKSYLCELISAFATPQRGAPVTFPGSDEECRKLLFAELLRSPAVIEFDNLNGDLVAHQSLCTVLTSEHMRDRVLGISKTGTVNTRSMFLSSGNNVGPVQDMTRRCITINMDPGCEVPAERRYTRPELVRDVLRARGEFVSAVLTIVRAWIVAGRPTFECKSLAGFSDWSALCLQPLLWLGLPDATSSVFKAMAEDPDRELLDRLLAEWEFAFGNVAKMVRDAVKLAFGPDDRYVDLREVLQEIADERGEINRHKLGRWIKRHAGRIVNGRRFVRASGNRSAEAWRVQSVLSVSSDSLALPAKSGGVAANGGNAYERASRGS